MCRLFGFRSVIQSQVHRSLLAADNALAVQSMRHSDGWGVAYYVADAPHVIKSTEPANEDHIFQRLSGIVASQTVVAHLRKATVGNVNILNSHPFQHGHWVFAHNGEVRNFESVQETLKQAIAPTLRRFILGDTDSETLFYLFLTYLSQQTDIHRRGVGVDAIATALGKVVTQVQSLVDGDGEDEQSKLSFLITDGATMVGFRRVTPLVFSTHKSRCPDRGGCPFLDKCCEAPTATGFVNHLLVSSEALSGEMIWEPLEEQEIIGVDWRMSLHRGRIEADGSVSLQSGYAPGLAA